MKLERFPFLDPENNWDEVSLVSLCCGRVSFTLSNSATDIVADTIIFDDYHYFSSSLETDRFIEMSMVGEEFDYKGSMFKIIGSDVVARLSNLPHLRGALDLIHYVLVDDDMWFEIVTSSPPQMAPKAGSPS